MDRDIERGSKRRMGAIPVPCRYKRILVPTWGGANVTMLPVTRSIAQPSASNVVLVRLYPSTSDRDISSPTASFVIVRFPTSHQIDPIGR
jgi:hypothetical protein